MRFALALCLVAIGCTRSFPRYPLGIEGEQRGLALSVSSLLIAPLESITLTATSSEGAVRFAVDPRDAGELSAGDTPTEARFSAGASGDRTVTLSVSDDKTLSRSVRVSIGPVLRASAPAALQAPGAKVRIDATGGKTPYTYTLLAADADDVLDADGQLTLGERGERALGVRVTDATAASARELTVQIGSALRLLASADISTLAPNEQVSFVAFGGAPPYTFFVRGGGAIDAITGVFTAGESGSSSEVVVSDSAMRSASLVVGIGEALSARLGDDNVHPSVVNRVMASGGKPPYAFRFSARGNHSGGSLDGITGTYVPGPNTGETDRLEVLDATGAVSAPVFAKLGAWRFALPPANHAVALDSNGDGGSELLFADLANTSNASLVRFDPQNGVAVQALHLGPTVPLGLRAVDADMDGHQDLALISRNDVRMYRSNADGSLGSSTTLLEQRSFAFTADGTGPSPEAFSAAIDWSVSPARWSLFFASGLGTNGTGCNVDNGGIARILLTPTEHTVSCIHEFTSAGGQYGGGPGNDISVLTARAGNPIVLHWLYHQTNHLATRALNGTTTIQAFPIGKPVPNRTRSEAQFFASLAPGSPLVIGYGSDGTRNADRITLFNGTFSPPPTRTAQITPASVLVPLAGPSTTQVLAQHMDATVVSRIEVTANKSVVTLGTIDTTVPVSAISAADIDGDKVSDFAFASSTAELGEIRLGDGQGRFGQHPRYATLGRGRVLAADIDGDGADEALSVSASGRLHGILSDAAGFATLPSRGSGLNVSAIALSAEAPATLALFTLDRALWTVRPSSTGFLAPTLVKSDLPRLYQTVAPAHFGGTAPGGDFFGAFFSANAAIFAAMARDLNQIRIIEHAVGVWDGDRDVATRCSAGAADLSGDGIDDLIGICFFDRTSAREHRWLPVMANSRIEADGALAFGELSVYEDTSALILLDSIESVPLWAGAVGRRAVFVLPSYDLGDGGIAVFDANAPDLVKIISAQFSAPAHALVGDVDGDGNEDLVVQATDHTLHVHLFRAMQAGFVGTPDIVWGATAGELVGVLRRAGKTRADLLFSAPGGAHVLNNVGAPGWFE